MFNCSSIIKVKLTRSTVVLRFKLSVAIIIISSGEDVREDQKNKGLIMSEGGIHQHQEGRQEDQDAKSPGAGFMSSPNSMQLLYEKLCLVNYSKDFCSEYKCRPIHR